MTRLSRSVVSRVGLALVAIAVSACATAGDQLSPSATFTTLMPGWESKFTLDWNVEPVRNGTTRLSGSIGSRYGEYAEPVELLAQGLDPSGTVVSQRIERVPGGVPGFGRVYFEIGPLAAADRYRVTVWAYSFVEDRGGAVP